MALPMWTKQELVQYVAEAAELKQDQVRDVLEALDSAVEDALKECERIRIGTRVPVTIEPVLRKARKARMGRNPATGEEVRIKAKPASVVIRAKVAKSGQGVAPSVRKLQNA